MDGPLHDAFPCRFDPVESVRLQRLGRQDPTMRVGEREVLRASRGPMGPATLRLKWSGDSVDAQAWGPSASWLLGRARAMCGLEDDPGSFAPDLPWLARMVDEHPHVALGQAPRLFDTVVAYVLQQRVKFVEAASSWRRIVSKIGEPAPGPQELLLPPSAQHWRKFGAAKLASFGVDQQRARILAEVALHHAKIDRLDGAELAHARQLLPKIRGIGPWTSSMALAVGCGDADALIVGDVSMPAIVAKAFVGKARSDDREMAELLHPYRPHRYRVLRLLFAAGVRRERRGPRRPRNPARG